MSMIKKSLLIDLLLDTACVFSPITFSGQTYSLSPFHGLYNYGITVYIGPENYYVLIIYIFIYLFIYLEYLWFYACSFIGCIIFRISSVARFIHGPCYTSLARCLPLAHVVNHDVFVTHGGLPRPGRGQLWIDGALSLVCWFVVP